MAALVTGCLPALSEPGDTAGTGGEAALPGGGGAGGTRAREAARDAPSAGGSASTPGSGTAASSGGAAVGVVPHSNASGGNGTKDASEPAQPGGAASGGTSSVPAESSSPGGEAGEGAAGAGGDPEPSTQQAELEAQTIERWNALADERGGAFNFHWTHDHFPHPTFAAMGTAEGYRSFAVLLDEFLTANFDFLAEHRQFSTPYYYVTASPSDEDLEVTWDELATDFSTMSYGDIPSDVQRRLAADAAGMKAYE